MLMARAMGQSQWRSVHPQLAFVRGYAQEPEKKNSATVAEKAVEQPASTSIFQKIKDMMMFYKDGLAQIRRDQVAVQELADKPLDALTWKDGQKVKMECRMWRIERLDRKNPV